MAYVDPAVEPLLLIILAASALASWRAGRCCHIEHKRHPHGSEWFDVYRAIVMTTAASGIVAIVALVLPHQYTPISRTTAALWFVVVLGPNLFLGMRLNSFGREGRGVQEHASMETTAPDARVL